MRHSQKISLDMPSPDLYNRASMFKSDTELSVCTSLTPSGDYSTYSSYTTTAGSIGLETDDAPHLLSPSQKGTCLAVLGECLDQLRILKRIYRIVAEDVPAEDLEYRSLAERFEQSGRNFAQYKINDVTHDFQTLLKQINTLIEVLALVCSEISERDTFTKLTQYLETAEKMKKDESNLLRDLKRKEKKVLQLRRAARHGRRKNEAALGSMYREMNNLKAELETVSAYYEQEQIYLEKWEKSRREQNDMVLVGKEEAHLTLIHDTEEKIKDENFCHSEISTFLEELRQDYLKQIEDWLERYDTDTEEKDNDIFRMRVEIERLTEQREALQAEYEKREKEIEEYLEVKRLKQEKEDREALEIWAAEKIQAWWRGVMFRKKLGPFRPKKKKGKGKGNKGKGKK